MLIIKINCKTNNRFVDARLRSGHTSQVLMGDFVVYNWLKKSHHLDYVVIR